MTLYLSLKRAFDLCIALTLLIVLAPIMVIVAGLVRKKLGSPVLFMQLRPGLLARPFHICKFRTMRNTRDDTGRLLSDQERLTALGRLLRRLSLDELPQLFNVVSGELSLVGPRPLLPEYLPLYTPAQNRRHEVKPGITGWAQINGRNAISWEDKFAFDVWYVDHRTFTLDLKILIMTAMKVVRSEGINQAGEATVSPFTGNPPPL